MNRIRIDIIESPTELWEWIRHNLPDNHYPTLSRTLTILDGMIINSYVITFNKDHQESAALLKLFWG